MLSVSSALICPAFGMPTRMPNCCCTLGSEIVGSMRPNSKGRPCVLLEIGEHLRHGDGRGGKGDGRAGAHRALRGRDRRAIGRHQRRARAVVGLGAIEIGLHHARQVVCPLLMAFCMSAIVDSSMRNGVWAPAVPAARASTERTATVRRNAVIAGSRTSERGWGLGRHRTERRRRLAMVRRRLVGRPGLDHRRLAARPGPEHHADRHRRHLRLDRARSPRCSPSCPASARTASRS